MDYEQAKLHKQALEKLNDVASSRLQKVEANGIGLVPEHIRMSKEFQELRRDYNKTHFELRNFNEWFMKKYKKEYLKDRKENRFKIK